MPQGPRQTAPVEPQNVLPSSRLNRQRSGWQQLRAHHRGGGQRHHERHQNGRCHHHRKLVEQATEHTPHEQNRNKHRDQRHADGHHREADIATALQHRLAQRHAALTQAGDVLKHHDRVIHHKPGGNRQRHQTQIVQTEIEQIHHGTCTGQRQRHSHGGNQRSAPTL